MQKTDGRRRLPFLPKEGDERGHRPTGMNCAEWPGGWNANRAGRKRKGKANRGLAAQANVPIWFGPQKKIEDCFLNFDS
jgi:hypothetical protein